MRRLSVTWEMNCAGSRASARASQRRQRTPGAADERMSLLGTWRSTLCIKAGVALR